MKNIIKFFIVAQVFISCTTIAQTVKPLSTFKDAEKTFIEEFHPVYYYKDTFNHFTPFLGQWKSVNGNKTFIVTLWKESKHAFVKNDNVQYYCDMIYGHYKLVQDLGLPTEHLIYTSQINIGNLSDVWSTVIVGGTEGVNLLNAKIQDIFATPVNPNKFPQGLGGYLTMEIITNTSPLTAKWHIIPANSLFQTDQPKEFVIPKDLILTKM